MKVVFLETCKTEGMVQQSQIVSEARSPTSIEYRKVKGRHFVHVILRIESCLNKLMFQSFQNVSDNAKKAFVVNEFFEFFLKSTFHI